MGARRRGRRDFNPNPSPSPSPSPNPDPDPSPDANPNPKPTPTPTPHPNPKPVPNPNPNPNLEQLGNATGEDIRIRGGAVGAAGRLLGRRVRAGVAQCKVC